MTGQKIKILFIGITIVFFIAASPLPVKEGMFPLSQLGKIDLVEAGLKLSPADIYNTEGISLIDALVDVDGCTGSFVSDEGLVLTNHHCATSSLVGASSVESNYVVNGFLAKSKGEEISVDKVFRVMESYNDVSEEILDEIKDITNLAERDKKIKAKMKELGKENTDLKNSIEAEVSEMFPGQTYVLFKYRLLKDIRLVYAPPKSVGNFGGETDNWTWPRHTGDFSFFRCYVAPDGSAAEYSKDNVPYKPKKVLKISQNGVDEGDFVFILGYPGRTFKNMPSQFIIYQNDFNHPYIIDLYNWMIDNIEEITAGDTEAEIRYASLLRSLNNVEKKYRGQLKAIRKTGLIDQRQNEERSLMNFVNSNPELKNEYSSLFVDLESVYEKKFQSAQESLWMKNILRFSNSVKIAEFILENSYEMQKPDSQREEKYKDENIEETIEKLLSKSGKIDEGFEIMFLEKMIYDAADFEENSRIRAVDKLIGKNHPDDIIPVFTDDNINGFPFAEKDYFYSLLKKTPRQLESLEDPFLMFVNDLLKQNKNIKEEESAIDGALSELLPKFNEIKRMKFNTQFVPDANGTLRLTYGYIKGYSPADAVYYSPFTTLNGLIEKSFEEGDYEVPEKIVELYKNKDFGKFYNKKLGGVPVALLYNTDTTGGNSGSPVMNAYGELIGLNFDRAFEATINDYSWDDSYSRSIGVDIRYILWFAQKYSGADNLLKEMNIEL
ncbi:MAG: S46 family peptidase [Bacteroidetes bacterium]|nr:S46 family peptidase [Bacteroidota bacterium]